MIKKALVLSLFAIAAFGCTSSTDGTAASFQAVRCSTEGTCGADQTCLAGVCTKECATDDQCAMGEVCLAGGCLVPSEEITSACRPTGCGEGEACIDSRCAEVPEVVSCEGEMSCPEGSTCLRGGCTADSEPPVACEGRGCDSMCTDDSECARGEFCGRAGTCVATAPTPGACEDDSTCPRGEFCVDGVCTTGDDTECSDDSECGRGQMCFLGECIMVPPPEPECTDDSECNSRQYCNTRTNTCEYSEPASCISNDECSGDRICIDGTCQDATRGCTDDSECWRGEVCNATTLTCEAIRSCRSDDACEAGEVCDLTTWTCTADEAIDCRADSACPAGLFCLDGTCQEGEGTECDDDAECGRGSMCFLGECIDIPVEGECRDDSECDAGLRCNTETRVCVFDEPDNCSTDDECHGERICEAGSCEWIEVPCSSNLDCDRDEFCSSETRTCQSM